MPTAEEKATLWAEGLLISGMLLLLRALAGDGGGGAGRGMGALRL